MPLPLPASPESEALEKAWQAQRRERCDAEVAELEAEEQRRAAAMKPAGWECEVDGTCSCAAGFRGTDCELPCNLAVAHGSDLIALESSLPCSDCLGQCFATLREPNWDDAVSRARCCLHCCCIDLKQNQTYWFDHCRARPVDS